MTDVKEESKEEKKKSGMNPLIAIGCGCFIILAVVGIILSIVMKYFAGAIGKKAVETVIEKNTGVKTNLSDLEKGKLSFKDEKTGATVDIGSGKIPDNFPKDFPLYPGAKVAGAMSGADQGSDKGFFVTLTTADDAAKVQAYYGKELGSKGWKVSSTYTAGDSKVQTIEKSTWQGSLSISGDSDKKETSIVITLGEKSASSHNQPEDQ